MWDSAFDSRLKTETKMGIWSTEKFWLLFLLCYGFACVPTSHCGHFWAAKGWRGVHPPSIAFKLHTIALYLDQSGGVRAMEG